MLSKIVQIWCKEQIKTTVRMLSESDSHTSSTLSHTMRKQALRLYQYLSNQPTHLGSTDAQSTKCIYWRPLRWEKKNTKHFAYLWYGADLSLFYLLLANQKTGFLMTRPISKVHSAVTYLQLPLPMIDDCSLGYYNQVQHLFLCY